ncbi:MAG: nucleoside transporter [Calditrichaeota bacterium]|nr:nucleoside transporter [Calditrichota bacterium]
MNILNFVSLLGLFILMGAAWAMSADRRRINWRVVFWGMGLQLFLAALIFTVPAGRQAFLLLNSVVVKIVDVAGAGGRFVFGSLALPPSAEGSQGFILAFQALPTIIFFGALLSLLYHFRILPWLIEAFAYIFTRWMRVSGAESLCTASNIFVGVESGLAVKPHLERMTKSELHTILTAMMATIASSVLGLYVMVLHTTFPNIAGHLISASLMSAPAALVMSKLLYPEKERPETMGLNIKIHCEKAEGPIVAAINGAMTGGKMVFGIVTLLIAVLGLAALVNLILNWLGGSVNGWLGTNIDSSLEGLLGYLMIPFTMVVGINPQDVPEVAKLIGERMIVTELQSYQDLNKLLADGILVDRRSAVLATYALCGFAHIASIGIFIGGLAAIIPNRIKDLAGLGFRALAAATLACLMTACAAGTFLTGSSVLFGK